VKPDPEMTGDQHGINSGWFCYPNLFDPVWMTKECTNFTPKEEPMKTLLEKIRNFNQPMNPNYVQALVDFLGESPSIETLEEVLKYYKREEKRLRTEDLLEWMNSNDQVNFETDDFKVSIRTFVSAKMADINKGFDWLNSHDYGDLIKTTVDFPKGEFTDEAKAALEEMGLSFTRKDGVHPQSLKKVMSDRLNAGEDLPSEDDGIKVGYFDECAVKIK
jgi:hypothetical protein